MKAVCLHDKNEIQACFSSNIPLHLYSLGDLDDFFWPHTTWYALKDSDGLKAVALLYSETALPVLLALAEETTHIRKLLQSITRLLPGRFYAHLSPGLEDAFLERHTLISHGQHYKMALTNQSLLDAVDTSQVVPLTLNDLGDIEKLYEQSYPGNWFEPRMLATKQYYGIRETEGLVSVAGVHVFSPSYKVAALGNIATHPNFRGRGLGRAVTAKLCQSLLEAVDHIGLNVQMDNVEALRCYRRLGFEVVAEYEEFLVEGKPKEESPCPS